METYGDYCPMSRAAEIFATRWTPLIIRNMMFGCRTFSEIAEGAPGMSRTLLTQRLRMLEHHGVVERVLGERGRPEYVLTEAGRHLEPVVEALATWGEQWIELSPQHYDGAKVMWSLTRKLDPAATPSSRTVLRFDLTAPERETYWLLLEEGRAEVCTRPPGEQDDLVVRATTEALTRWHLGQVELGAAMHAGTIQVQGPLELERLLASWGGGATVASTFGRPPRHVGASPIP